MSATESKELEAKQEEAEVSGKPESGKPDEVTAPGAPVCGRPLEVSVDDRGLERAIRTLRRRVANEGVTKMLKRRRCYEKPSVRKRRKQREAERRRRRAARRIVKPRGMFGGSA